MSPGWFPGSWAYHGDDGLIYDGYEDNGRRYGETYTKDDTIGCGVDLKRHTIYFTKNGKYLGV